MLREKSPWLVFSSVCLCSVLGCGENPLNAIWPEPQERNPNVSRPVYSLASGDYNYAATLTVSIICTTAGASVKYSTDGSDPKTSATAVVGTSVSLTSSKTIRAYAFKSGMKDSDENDGTFNVYKTFLYVGDTGSYAGSGIYKYEVSMATGELLNRVFYNTNQCSTLAVDPARKILYAATNGGHGMSSFPINTDGSLGTQTANFNLGDSPGEMVVHPNAKFLYGVLGTTQVFEVDVTSSSSTDWTMNVFSNTHTTPSDVAIKPSGDYLFALYQGDNILASSAVDQSTGTLTYQSGVASSSPSAAITSLVTHPSLPALYVLQSFTVASFTVIPTSGALSLGPSENCGNVRSLAIDPIGKFLYVGLQASTPSKDPIREYPIDQGTGLLNVAATVQYSSLTSGTSDYHIMAIDPTGNFLYNYTDDTQLIQVFSIDRATGALTELSAYAQTFPGAQASVPVFTRVKQ